MKGLRRIQWIAYKIIKRPCFYLVTWMKGLRPYNWFFRILTLFMFLPCDLNEGITTYFALCYAICHFIRFYLVTWMKGLRLAGNLTFHGQYQVLFLPCDLNEGITTWALEYPCNLRSLLCFYLVTWMKGLRHIIASTYVLAYTYKVFTLWPEWRDYDPLCRVGHWPAQTCFYLVTWMKGLRRISNSRTTVFISIPFLPCDLNEGITTWITLKPT